jgi:hypothetical protein
MTTANQNSPSARSSASVSAALTAAGAAARRSKVSNQAARAADLSIVDELDWRFIQVAGKGGPPHQRYRDSSPHGSIAPISPETASDRHIFPVSEGGHGTNPPHPSSP